MAALGSMAMNRLTRIGLVAVAAIAAVVVANARRPTAPPPPAKGRWEPTR